MADRTDGGPEDQGEPVPPPYPSAPGSGLPPRFPGGGDGGTGGAYPLPGGYGAPGGYPPPGPDYDQGGYRSGGVPYGYGPGPTVSPVVYAGYWPRVGGWLIDAVIVWVVSYLVSIPLHNVDIARFTITTHTSPGVTRTGHFSALEAVAEVAIVLVYGAIFCGSARGQTPGMMAVGVRAVDRDTGGRVGFARALWRGVFEYVLFIVLFVPWVVDMLFPLWDFRHQTLHDKVSRTVVVKASLYPPASAPR
jgi:uncharacterized RDD family membrane protein YckC